MKILPNIGILMPGDMGHGCGKVLLDNNFKVFTCLSKRSERTKMLSQKSGITDTDNIQNLLNEFFLFHDHQLRLENTNLLKL